MGSSKRLLAWLLGSQSACLLAGLLAHYQLLSAVRQSQTGDYSSRPAASLDEPTLSTEEIMVYPFSFIWTAGLQSISAWLILQQMQGRHSKREQQTQEESLLTAKELVRTRDAIIFGLAKLAESRDPDTGHHLERIALYATRLATALRRHPKYRSEVSPTFIRMIGISSALHDIGKVGVADSILLKPGKLTEGERFKIQVHTKLGGDCIRQIEQRLGNSHFLQMAREIALHHHERWDGSGYPDGLKGEQIPLAARIVAIADVYDALSVKRVYKDAYAHEICVEKIRCEAGRQFDPGLVEVFLSIEEHFREIAQSFDHTTQQLTGVFQEAVNAGLMSPEDVSPPVGARAAREQDGAAVPVAAAEKPPVTAPPESISSAC